MKLQAYVRHFHTFELENAIVVGESPDQIITWERVPGTFQGTFIPEGSVFAYLSTNEVLSLAARVTNLRDRGGNLILPLPGLEDGQSYLITEAEPIINAFGFRESTRYRCRRVSDEDAA